MEIGRYSHHRKFRSSQKGYKELCKDESREEIQIWSEEIEIYKGTTRKRKRGSNAIEKSGVIDGKIQMEKYR